MLPPSRSRCRPRQLLAASALLCSALAAVAAPAAAAPSEEHCVVTVTGQHSSGEFITTAPECHRSYSDAMRSAGAGDPEPRADMTATATATTFVLATHYSGANFTGSSTSVVGTDCAGGWLNTSTVWKNVISSTANGCNRVSHFDGTNLTGASEDTLGTGGNLSTLDNRTESIQYST